MLFKNMTIEDLAALASRSAEYKNKPEVITLLKDIEKYIALGMYKVSEQLTKQAAACVLEQLGYGLLEVEDAWAVSNWLNARGRVVGYYRPAQHNRLTYNITHIHGDGKIDILKPPILSEGGRPPLWDSIALKEYDTLIPHDVLSKIDINIADDLTIFKPDQSNVIDPILAVSLHTPQYVPIREEDDYNFLPRPCWLKRLVNKALRINNSKSMGIVKAGKIVVLGETSVERTRYYVMLSRWE